MRFAAACTLAAALAAAQLISGVANAETCDATDAALEAEIRTAIGLPVYHDDLGDPGQRRVICHGRFCSLFDGDRKIPVWVVERLAPEIVTGDNSRPSQTWRGHDAVQPPRDVTDEEYTHSGFARGHMAASADFKFSEACMRETFRFSNAVPQIQDGFNGSVWKALEENVQELAGLRSEIFVITGPVHLSRNGAAHTVSAAQNGCGHEIALPGASALGKSAICDDNDNDATTRCAVAGDVGVSDREIGISVPAGLYKIVYVPETSRIFGFVMPNIDHRPLKGRLPTDRYLERWRATIGVIEDLTSLEFFSAFDRRTKSRIREECTETRWR